LAGADVNVNGGFYRVEIGIFSEMRLFVLGFYGVVGQAAIDVMAVNTNTHSRYPLCISKRLVKFELSVNLA
jgi:hypothetical protein